MLRCLCFAAYLAFVSISVTADPGSKDEIINLPGLNFDINFKHYSGYLRVSKTKFLHYWFVESQNDPTNDPLIFWFNGGPGCSSLEGLLHEMGPYLVNPDGKTLRANPNAWNKFASVVYIESPAGVGYSYASDGNTSASDTMTANYNYKGLKQFFTLHPSFRNYRTFIIGESYGGIYVPTLAAKIVDGQSSFPINFEGIGIGNGMLNWLLFDQTSFEFGYAHGLFDEEAWNKFEKQCCHGCFDTCNTNDFTDECFVMGQNLGIDANINLYDIYRNCDSSSLLNSPRMSLYRPQTFINIFEAQLKKKSLIKNTQSNGIPCFNDTDIETYMNNPEVRKALHINENLGEWSICNDELHNHYDIQVQDTAPYFKKIIAANVRVLLYYGDTDTMCNFLGGQKFTDQLGYQLLKPKYAFEVNGQVGGFATVYDKNVTFVTIRGAGHMAPEWKAPETKYVIEKYIQNQNI